MAELRDITEEVLPQCAAAYQKAYGEAPWNESFSTEQLTRYLRAFLHPNVKCGYGFMENEQIVGIALGLLVPCFDAPFSGWRIFALRRNTSGRATAVGFCVRSAQKSRPSGAILCSSVRNAAILPTNSICERDFKRSHPFCFTGICLKTAQRTSACCSRKYMPQSFA